MTLSPLPLRSTAGQALSCRHPSCREGLGAPWIFLQASARKRSGPFRTETPTRSRAGQALLQASWSWRHGHRLVRLCAQASVAAARRLSSCGSGLAAPWPASSPKLGLAAQLPSSGRVQTFTVPREGALPGGIPLPRLADRALQVVGTTPEPQCASPMEGLWALTIPPGRKPGVWPDFSYPARQDSLISQLPLPTSPGYWTPSKGSCPFLTV